MRLLFIIYFMCYLNDPIKFFAFSNIKNVQYDLIFIVIFFFALIWVYLKHRELDS